MEIIAPKLKEFLGTLGFNQEKTRIVVSHADNQHVNITISGVLNE